jgi:hypothetical protein
MLALVRQRPNVSMDKPNDIVRGPSSRLPWAWDGLCFAVPFHTADFLGMRDVVNEVAPTSATNVSWIRDNRGNVAAVLGATSFIDYADHPRHDLPSTEITVYVRFQRVGLGDNFGALICNVYSTGAPWDTWAIGDTSPAAGKINGSIAIPPGPNLVSTPDTGVVGTTEYVTAILRWRDGTAHTMDVLGERGNSIYAVTSASNFPGPLQYAAAKGVRINANEQTTPDDFSANYSQVLIWKRRLSDPEQAALVADPFGWCSPRAETVTVAAPFPIGPGMAMLGLRDTRPSNR